MSDQPEENSKPEGFIKKFTTYWDTLSGSIKKTTALIVALGALLAAIIGLIKNFDIIKERICPSISKEILAKIPGFENLPAEERTPIINECSEFKTQCLSKFLDAGEKMRSSTEPQNEIIDWISLTSSKLGNDEVYDACVLKANEFLDTEINSLSDKEDIYDGFGFYIKLFERIEIGHEDEVKTLFNKMLAKIDQSILEPFAKNGLHNKINQQL